MLRPLGRVGQVRRVGQQIRQFAEFSIAGFSSAPPAKFKQSSVAPVPHVSLVPLFKFRRGAHSQLLHSPTNLQAIWQVFCKLTHLYQRSFTDPSDIADFPCPPSAEIQCAILYALRFNTANSHQYSAKQISSLFFLSLFFVTDVKFQYGDDTVTPSSKIVSGSISTHLRSLRPPATSKASVPFITVIVDKNVLRLRNGRKTGPQSGLRRYAISKRLT